MNAAARPSHEAGPEAVKVPLAVLEALARSGLSGQELGAALYILARSLAASGAAVPVPLADLAGALQISKPRASLILSSLAARGVLQASGADNSLVKSFALRPPAAWTGLENTIRGVIKKDNTVIKKDNTSGKHTICSKDLTTKTKDYTTTEKLKAISTRNVKSLKKEKLKQKEKKNQPLKHEHKHSSGNWF